MYIISNNDFESIIEYIKLALQSIKTDSLRSKNKKRKAELLLGKLHSKNMINKSDLPNNIKKRTTQK